ncbi:Uncharacterised protein (plasmid) [Legionella adelaidensis]|uniref:Uncharacterized protein n=1 Tax=Legionella adelaidensis TaxID=45056 RepID=A0A0W0R0Z3_9GAMM|nr:hypothetical protein [Legionella adelaidensis]KTC64742.1 hypothetical protein Lade_2036 [Legionella adelaidensis]VEH81284.1 Uncharacterised protein [Legionella adelaidensis]
MKNIAALRWLPRGKLKPPVIQYMLLDDQLEYLIYPKEIEVINLKKDIYKIFFEIENVIAAEPLEVYYKSITVSYGMHRSDSLKFHRLIKKILRRKGLTKINNRTVSLLKKEQLKKFKNALYLMDIDCKAKGNAFIAHLWTIGLKATRKQVDEAIKKIWKSRYGIKRLNKELSEKYAEFYSLL